MSEEDATKPLIASPPRLEWVDSLRALAALWVVAHHAFRTAPFVPRGPLERWLAAVLNHGDLAVTAFIALSGFSLAIPLARREWRLKNGYREYIVARCVRILPPYYVLIVLTLLVSWVHTSAFGDPLGPAQVRDVGIAALKHLFLVQDLDGTLLLAPPAWTNAILWTIGVEFKIYLLFPLMLLAIRRGGLVGGGALTLALAAAFTFTPGLSAARKPGFLVVFFLGVLACALAGRVRRPWAIVLSAFAVVATLVCLQTDPSTRQLPRDLVFGAGFCALLTSVGTLPRLSNLLNNRWTASVGTFAYSLYLVHALAIQAIVLATPLARTDGTFRSSAVMILISIAVALPLAYGFHLLFERPFFRRRHRIAESLVGQVARE